MPTEDQRSNLQYRVAWMQASGEPVHVDEASLIATGSKREHLPVKWLCDMQPGDEIWWFRTEEETWRRRCGRAGWALLRNGQPVDHLIVIMN